MSNRPPAQKLWGYPPGGRRGKWDGGRRGRYKRASARGCEARLSGGGAKMTLTDIYVYVTIVNLLVGGLSRGDDLDSLQASAQVASVPAPRYNPPPVTASSPCEAIGTGAVKAPLTGGGGLFPFPIPIPLLRCIDDRSPNHMRPSCRRAR